MPKNNSSTLSPYTVTITYCWDEPRWLDSTRYHTMPSPCDIVTITGTAKPHFSAEENTATEAVNCASSLPNLDSAANPLDTNKGVRTTSWQDSSARPGSSQTPRHKLGRATPCASTALWRTYIPQHFLCRFSFVDNKTDAMKSARTCKGGIFEHFPRR